MPLYATHTVGGSDICPNASEDRVCDMVNFTIRESWLIKNENDVLVVVPQRGHVYFLRKKSYIYYLVVPHIEQNWGPPKKINGPEELVHNSVALLLHTKLNYKLGNRGNDLIRSKWLCLGVVGHFFCSIINPCDNHLIAVATLF